MQYLIPRVQFVSQIEEFGFDRPTADVITKDMEHKNEIGWAATSLQVKQPEEKSGRIINAICAMHRGEKPGVPTNDIVNWLNDVYERAQV